MDVRDITRELYNYRDSRSWDAWLFYRDEIKVVRDVGFVRVADKKMGDWQGDDIFIVFEILFPDNSADLRKFYKIDGSYSSFGQSSWDEPVYEVQPRTTMSVVYERVEEDYY